MLRSPVFFSGAFVLMAVAYAAYFNITVRVNPEAAMSRFTVLMATDTPARAARHGERALAMRQHEGASEEDLAALKSRIAQAQLSAKEYNRASILLKDALSTQWARRLAPRARIRLENELGRTYILSNSIEEAVSIYASFLELAGDAAAQIETVDEDSIAVYYANLVGAAGDDFTEALNHASAHDLAAGRREAVLATANQMADLGGFYALRDDGAYAAAGLLSTAYETRRNLLGGDHQDTVQLTLILGPLFMRMGRIDDAESLYLEAFHAQERVKGANNPDLSLYIKLLAGVYEQQGRMTEAQALNEHMRNLFRDAFGAKRYSVNQERDRRADINRPVSQYFTLEPSYAPGDLVSAAEYSIPTSKAPSLDEMMLRLAADANADPREANLPVRLAQLISLCRSDSGERISLRSGYRSYRTQSIVFERNGARGTVTPAGMSEHQTGLAADINVNGRFMRQSDRTYQCFEENAFRFGFILSYPPNNDYLPGEDSYEPWHWRYVGVQTAHLYREAGPYDQPQEFLAALPCYQERAASGIFPTAGQEDICLSQPTVITAAMEPEEPLPSAAPSPDAARILNDAVMTAPSRQ
jgi:tetratricopeptide (TPR) repeat protein